METILWLKDKYNNVFPYREDGKEVIFKTRKIAENFIYATRGSLLESGYKINFNEFIRNS